MNNAHLVLICWIFDNIISYNNQIRNSKFDKSYHNLRIYDHHIRYFVCKLIETQWWKSIQVQEWKWSGFGCGMLKIKSTQKPNITCFFRFSSFFWISFSRFCSAMVSLVSSSLLTSSDLAVSCVSTEAFASASFMF